MKSKGIIVIFFIISIFVIFPYINFMVWMGGAGGAKNYNYLIPTVLVPLLIYFAISVLIVKRVVSDISYKKGFAVVAGPLFLIYVLVMTIGLIFEIPRYIDSKDKQNLLKNLDEYIVFDQPVFSIDQMGTWTGLSAAIPFTATKPFTLKDINYSVTAFIDGKQDFILTSSCSVHRFSTGFISDSSSDKNWLIMPAVGGNGCLPDDYKKLIGKRFSIVSLSNDNQQVTLATFIINRIED